MRKKRNEYHETNRTRMADYDAGDEKQVKNKKSRTQRIEERQTEELKQVLSTYEGRSLLWRVLSMCRIYKDSFTGDNYTFYNEGKRSVGLDIITEIEQAEPHALAKMRDEAVERDLND